MTRCWLLIERCISNGARRDDEATKTRVEAIMLWFTHRFYPSRSRELTVYDYCEHLKVVTIGRFKKSYLQTNDP